MLCKLYLNIYKIFGQEIKYYDPLFTNTVTLAGQWEVNLVKQIKKNIKYLNEN